MLPLRPAAGFLDLDRTGIDDGANNGGMAAKLLIGRCAQFPTERGCDLGDRDVALLVAVAKVKADVSLDVAFRAFEFLGVEVKSE
jgi:hypothetical protein